MTTLTAQEIARHIATFPAGTRITVVFEIGEAASTTATGHADGGSPRDPRSDPGSPAPVPQPQAPTAIKLAEANRRFGLPIRELQRAVKGRFLAAIPKLGGKDSGAHLVEPDNVAAYREKRERILRGEEALPGNWPGPKPKAPGGEGG